MPGASEPYLWTRYLKMYQTSKMSTSSSSFEDKTVRLSTTRQKEFISWTVKRSQRTEKKRTGQETDSLEDWYYKQVKAYGKQKADWMRSRLKVTKSRR